MRRTLTTAALALLTFLHASRAAQKEIWAQSRLAGNSAGYYHESASVRPDGNIVTSIENDIVLNRLGSKVEIKSASQYLETQDGRLLSVDSTSSSSSQATELHVDAGATSLFIRTTTGGKSYERTLTVARALLGPEAARRLTISRLKSTGDAASYDTFVPDLASIVTVTEKCLGTSPLEIEETLSALPTPTMVWLDDAGWLLRQTVATPFGSIETVRAPAAEVSAEAGAGASLPAEAFGKTLVRSNIRLPEERLIEELEIGITHREPELGWPDFEAPNQTVLESSRDRVVLRIRRVMPDGGEFRRAGPAGADLRPFHDANPLVQSDDAEVRTIAASVAGNAPNAYEAARRLQQWTNEHMGFDPGVAVAPASEVIRNRRGTCLGYAILLASLLRADGIPSRIRMGFVYAGGIWGGHAWVEMMGKGGWVPLDAALYSPGPADAARFSFFTSGLEEGAIAGMGALARLYGHVNIEILGYTIHGRHVTVPTGAKPFTIDGDTYRNPWLGLTVNKPTTFRFTELESVWPDSTLLAMEGPGGQLVEIQSHSQSLPSSQLSEEAMILRAAKLEGARSSVGVGGRRVIASDDRAATLVVHGGDLLVVTAKAANPAELLSRVMKGLTLDARP